MPRFDRRQFLAASSLAAAIPAGAASRPEDFTAIALKTEYCERPLAIEEAQPRFSWQMASGRRGARQTAYRIVAASSLAALKEGRYDVWDSGRVPSDRNFEIRYQGRVLRSSERIFWRVRLWDEFGQPSRLSEPTWFEMGLMTAEAWRGDWLIAQSDEEAAARAAGLHWIWGDGPPDEKPVRFRYRFALTETPSEAWLWLSAKDILKGVWLNGHEITPARKAYWGTMCRLPLALAAGTNLLCVEAAATGNDFHPYDGGAVAALLRIADANGRVTRLTTANGWRTSNADDPSWVRPDYNDTAWPLAIAAKAKMQCEPWPAMPAMLMRRAFAIAKPIARARLHATALGAYEFHLNGRRVSDAVLAPEISTARSHIFYQKYDVTGLLQPGRNALGAIIADGWYGSGFGARDERYSFGAGPKRLLAQLEIQYRDGSREIIATDGAWRVTESAVRAADIYNGEHSDAQREMPGWSRADFDDRNWRPAAAGARPSSRLIAQNGPPVRQTGSLDPVAITEPKPGVFVADFGQNFAGWVRLTTTGARGNTVTLRYAEILKSDGTADQSNLRGAEATDRFDLAGGPHEICEPRFTYHGFRYVEIAGLGSRPHSAAIEGIVVRTDAPETGTFACDNALVQRIWHNALWSQRSNFFAIPTDCPQRDERMGWTGDIQVFLDAAAFNMDVGAFIRRYLREVRAEQLKDGGFPVLAPAARSYVPTISPGWSEAGVVLPWMLYRRYGDLRVIEDNWTAMTRWMEFLAANNPDYLWRHRRGTDLGDWLSVDAVNPGDETTPKLLIATASWARCAALMAEMANAIARPHEALQYADIRNRIGDAFAAAFVRTDGSVGNGSQTGYVLSLQFGLVPAPLTAAAGRHLAADIVSRGMKLSTGFLGTPYLLDVLSDHGHAGIATSLLLKTDYPSWGYMIRKGATTMWERWNSDTGDVAMNSYNHYAFGAVAGFLYRRLAGIAPAAPGFRKIAVRPVFDPRIGRVKAVYRSCLGPIASELRGDHSGLSRLILDIPANATAEVHLPQQRSWQESGRQLTGRNDVKIAARNRDSLIVEIAAGHYDFRTP